MLKRRIIACLMVQNNLVVQSIGFKQFLPIGKLDIALEFLEYWDIDEIIILDIDATLNNRVFNHNIIKDISKKIFIPISIGGGIKSIDDVSNIITSGADKVVLNSVAYSNPDLIKECKNSFGTQSIIVSIDVKKDLSGQYKVYIESGTKQIEISFKDYIKQIEQNGAGEIIINSIDNDGKKNGYDIELINLTTNLVNIPIIAMGGAGNSQHFVDVLDNTKVSGVAAGNMFHFLEHSTAISKAYLKNNFNNIRVNNILDYSKHKFDTQCRILGDKI